MPWRLLRHEKIGRPESTAKVFEWLSFLKKWALVFFPRSFRWFFSNHIPFGDGKASLSSCLSRRLSRVQKGVGGFDPWPDHSYSYYPGAIPSGEGTNLRSQFEAP